MKRNSIIYRNEITKYTCDEEGNIYTPSGAVVKQQITNEKKNCKIVLNDGTHTTIIIRNLDFNTGIYNSHTKRLYSKKITYMPKDGVAYRFIDDNNYVVEDTGEVFSIRAGCYLKKQLQRVGYYSVTLTGRKIHYIHRLVYEAFYGSIGDVKYVAEINHKDLNRLNNKLSNLEVVTRRENLQHCVGIRGRLQKKLPGEWLKCPNRMKKSIAKYDLNNNLVKIFENISIASKEENMSNGLIRYKIYSGSKKNGFIYKYYEKKKSFNV